MRALCLVLAALLLPPLALAQAEPSSDATFLVYHVFPDPRAGQEGADPFSSPDAPLPAGLADADGRLRLPATRLDGVSRVSDAPEGDPASALARFREMQRLLLARQRMGSPVALTVAGRVEEGTLRLDLLLEPAPSLGDVRAEVRVVAFEDGLPDPLAPRAHRHVARLALEPASVNLSREAILAQEVPLDPAWDLARVGVVVSVVHVGDASRHEPGEALQSATWRVGQVGATRQVGRAVLVEHATATWCEACLPADEAVALLASQFGDAGASTSHPGSYLRAPTPLALAGLAGGALAGVLLARRRRA